MIFEETNLKDAFVIEMEPHNDERGFFARTWCEREFREHGLNPFIKQCNVSFNKRTGTLRGMHYQDSPHQEAKVVRCTRGAIFDVIIDLRKDSSTFKQFVTVVLSEDNYRMLYVPEGFAHGFQTLAENTEVFYQMTEFYFPEMARGIRWDDPAFDIPWPMATERFISERDRTFPDFVS
jgi:dTDP-4-dehydrorhamnose 3,5-epimerase